MGRFSWAGLSVWEFHDSLDFTVISFSRQSGLLVWRRCRDPNNDLGQAIRPVLQTVCIQVAYAQLPQGCSTAVETKKVHGLTGFRVANPSGHSMPPTTLKMFLFVEKLDFKH
jgi:hypothetical protein